MTLPSLRSMNISVTTSGSVFGREADRTSYPRRSFPKRSTKRVRTGCWTCRSRHLKCDELYPVCTPCQKSNRLCDPVRGVRLRGWKLKTWDIPEEVKCVGPIGFVDETRDIVKEYDVQGIINGGLEAYGWQSEEDSATKELVSPIYGSNVHDMTTSSATSHRSHTLSHSMDWTSGTQTPSDRQGRTAKQKTIPRQQFLAPPWTESNSSQNQSISQTFDQPITNGEELQIFQAFVNDIGCWMDLITAVKYFSHIIPYRALHIPMLRNAILACGIRHLHLLNPKDWDAHLAMKYCNEATIELRTRMANKNQTDKPIQAIAAVILNVYLLLTDDSEGRITLFNLSRDLMQQCGWNATSSEEAGACFWMHRNIELLNCLTLKCPVLWHPDEWGLGPDYLSQPLPSRPGDERLWVQRVIFIVSKIVSFVYADSSTRSSRQKWRILKDTLDAWDNQAPTTLRPLGEVLPGESMNKHGRLRLPSKFPQIYLPHPVSVLARTYYHTGVILLSQHNPDKGIETRQVMEALRKQHARMICGIVKYSEDRAIASFTIRSCLLAAECLTDPIEQDELLKVLDGFEKHTCWPIGPAVKNLNREWEKGKKSVQADFFMPSGPSTPGPNEQVQATNNLHTPKTVRQIPRVNQHHSTTPVSHGIGLNIFQQQTHLSTAPSTPPVSHPQNISQFQSPHNTRQIGNFFGNSPTTMSSQQPPVSSPHSNASFQLSGIVSTPLYQTSQMPSFSAPTYQSTIPPISPGNISPRTPYPAQSLASPHQQQHYHPHHTPHSHHLQAQQSHETSPYSPYSYQSLHVSGPQFGHY